jgi:hypothetical protein
MVRWVDPSLWILHNFRHAVASERIKRVISLSWLDALVAAYERIHRVHFRAHLPMLEL